MVVPYEMEKTVDREMGDLAAKGPPRGLRLRARGLDRNVDFPEVEVAVPIGQIARFREWKREDVGGPVDLEKIPVQRPDPLVAGEDQRNGGARKAQDPERPPEERSKSGRS